VVVPRVIVARVIDRSLRGFARAGALTQVPVLDYLQVPADALPQR